MKNKPSLIKRTYLIAMSFFLMWQSYNLMIKIPGAENLAWGMQVFYALVINLFFTGVFAFAGFALPTQEWIPQKYFEIHDSKKLKFWFQKLRVKRFRKFLLATVWKNKDMQKEYFNGTVEGITEFETNIKKSELGHIFPFIWITGFCVFLIKTKIWVLIIATMFVNIFFNLYPVLLQRHHRMRLLRLKKIIQEKQKK